MSTSVEPDGRRVAAASDDDLAAGLRGFGPAGILALLVIVAGAVAGGALVAAPLVLLWAGWSRTPWTALGLERPRSWPVTIGTGVLGGVALKLLLKAVVMPLLGAPLMNAQYHALVGNRTEIPGMLFTLVVGAGFGEELLYRGYLFERLRKRLGWGAGARAAIVAVTSLLFGLAHYTDQGVPGVEQAVLTGLAFGTAYAVTGRIWGVMAAHAAFDLAAYAILYWGLEADVGHLIFK